MRRPAVRMGLPILLLPEASPGKRGGGGRRRERRREDKEKEIVQPPGPLVRHLLGHISTVGWGDRHHLSNLSVSKEQHDRLRDSIAVKHIGNSRGIQVFPPTKGPLVFPHGLTLGFLGLALREEEMMGLLLVPITLPESVRGYCGIYCQIVPHGRLPPTGAGSIGPPGLSYLVGVLS